MRKLSPWYAFSGAPAVVAGIGEMHLLRLASTAMSKRRRGAPSAVLPNSATLEFPGMGCPNLIWAWTPTSADALLSTDQILRNSSCGAVLLWQTNAPPEARRRLTHFTPARTTRAADSRHPLVKVAKDLCQKARSEPAVFYGLV